MSVAPFNIYGFLKDKLPALSPHLRSSTLSLSLHKEDGSPLAIDGSNQKISINLPVKVSMDDVSGAKYVRAVMSPTNQNVDLFYHTISLTNQVGSLNIEVVPEDPDVQLAVYIRYDDFPSIRAGEWDVFGVVPRKMSLLGMSVLHIVILFKRHAPLSSLFMFFLIFFFVIYYAYR